jgi:hypothetical protein
MEKVREMGLYPVVLAEGRFTASKRLAHAMEIAYKALCAADAHVPEATRSVQGVTAITITSTSPSGS